jgi:cysteine desulfurase
MRAGTENVYGIVGFARALELATAGYEEDSAYIKGLKVYMMEQLKRQLKGSLLMATRLAGACIRCSAYLSQRRRVRNAPVQPGYQPYLCFRWQCLHQWGGAGVACDPGINNNPNQVTVRFSFSKHNTREQVDSVAARLKELI